MSKVKRSTCVHTGGVQGVYRPKTSVMVFDYLHTYIHTYIHQFYFRH